MNMKEIFPQFLQAVCSKWKGKGYVFLSSIVFILAGPGNLCVRQALAGSPCGTVTFLEGTAMVQHAQTSQWQVLKIKDRVYLGDNIKTGSDSRLTLCLVDESTITLGPQSEFQLDNFSFSPSKNQRKASVKVLMGKARFSIRRVLASPSRFEVTTPTAVAGVKGTKFVVWVITPELTRFLVTEGVISIRNALPSIPLEVFLSAGFASDVRSGQGPVAPYRLSPEEIKKFLEGTTGMEPEAMLEVKTHIFRIWPSEIRYMLRKQDTADNIFPSILNERENRNIPRLLPEPPAPPSQQGD